MNSLTDNAVMLLVRNGDVEKLGLLFERHHQMLFNFFLRLTARREFSEDLAQEVFFRMLKYRHTFQPDNQYRPWMFQIARNAHFDAARRGRRDALPDDVALDEEEREIACPEPTPDLRAGRRQEIDLLQTALARLPVEKREVLLLSRIQELKFDEVGEILGCDANTAKVRAHRALKELREIFQSLSKGKVYEV